MGTPKKYLPPKLGEDVVRELAQALDLPRPQRVRSLNATAEYHSIYVLSFSREDAKSISAVLRPVSADGPVDLVLRVSGNHLPHIKTENEVAVMSWVRSNTQIPTPQIVRFDATPNNILGHEFSLMEYAAGKPLHEVYDRLDPAKLSGVVDQLIDIVEQLHSHSWNRVSGLALDDSGVVPGPVLEETFWQAPDVAKYWPASESVASLNIRGPYESYTAYISAQVGVYQHAIRLHDSLSGMRDLLPRLDRWVETLAQHPELNETRYVLAHRDLHMANIMYDEASGRITAVLDWEFSGIVPIQRWDPSRAFLWNGQRNARALEEQQRLLGILKERCAARGLDLLASAEYTSSLQEEMQGAINFLRAIIEVCPRQQRADKVPEWRAALEAHLETFGC